MSRICEFDLSDREIDIVDNERYRLGFGWRPRIARRKQNLIGGGGSYEPVLESLPLQVRGDSYDEVYEAVHDLAEMLDQADLFYQTGQGNPVVWRWRSDNSSAAEPQSVLIRRSVGETLLNFLDNYVLRIENDTGQVVVDVRLEFERSPLWLDESATTDMQVTTAALNPGVATNFLPSDHVLPSPAEVRLVQDDGLATEILMLVASDEDYTGITVQHTMTAGSGITESSVGTASGGKLYQVDAAATAARLLTFNASFFGSTAIYDVYVSLKNGAGVDFTIDFISSFKLATEPINVSATLTTPTIVRGSITLIEPGGTGDLILSITPQATAGGALDIDVVAVMVRSEHSFAVLFPNMDISVNQNGNPIHVRPRALESRQADAVIEVGASRRGVNWRGDAYIEVSGTAVGVGVIGNTLNDWRMRDSHSSGSVVNANVLLDVQRGYLVPR